MDGSMLGKRVVISGKRPKHGGNNLLTSSYTPDDTRAKGVRCEKPAQLIIYNFRISTTFHTGLSGKCLRDAPASVSAMSKIPSQPTDHAVWEAHFRPRCVEVSGVRPNLRSEHVFWSFRSVAGNE